jgi:hypothetical protein
MKKSLVSLTILFSILQMHAQNTSFDATVNKNSVAQNERIQLTLTITNGGTIKSLQPPSLNDFIVLGGPRQVNGTQTTSYLYILQPKSTGKFIIGSAYVKVNDKTISTQPISITVHDKPVTTSINQFNQESEPSGSEDDVYEYIKKNVFIKTEINDADIYEGETITVTSKIYKSKNSSIYDYRIIQAVKVPKYDGFYVEDVQLIDKQPQTVTFNGQQYSVSIVRRTLLTPQKAGMLEIDTLTLDIIFGVRTKKQKNKSGDPRQDLLDELFGYGGNKEVRYSISSLTQQIKIKELPGSAPPGFNGAVGKFTMRTEINSDTTKTDEPLIYKVIIAGTGNLNLFNPPRLILPRGWETYDPKTSEISGEKSFEYILIPRLPGDFTIPVYSWSYFDPTKKQYQTLSSESYNVKVDPGPGYNPDIENYEANKAKVEMLAKDIRSIKKNQPNYTSEKFNFFGSALFYSLLGFPFIAGIGFFMFTSKRKKIMGDEVSLKYNQANIAVRKRLAKAKEFEVGDNSRSFYDETNKAMGGYLTAKLNLPQSELTKEKIYELLIAHSVSTQTANETITLLDICEMGLFAPQLNSISMDNVYKNANDLITKLENELK